MGSIKLPNNLVEIYSPKQVQIVKECRSRDWFLLINSGAKRSGKTVINNDLWLQELMRVRRIADKENIKNPMYIIAGAGIKNIYQNILLEISNRYGIEIKFDRLNNFYLMGVYVVQVGHGSIGGLGRIRGMTAQGAYINEASLANRIVFDEIISRCSGTGARILTDTNPDHPEHWLKKDYMDNPAPDTIVNHFTLYDNTFLNKRYVDNIIATTPPGLLTDRNIKGLWVRGEGVVYDMFDETCLYDEDKNHWYEEYCVSIDYGTQNATVFLLWGLRLGVWYLIKEYYHSGRDEKKQKAPSEYVDAYIRFTSNYNVSYTIVDPSASPLRTEFAKRGIPSIKADNAVLNGIYNTMNCFHNGIIKIGRNCTKTIYELNTYSWKEGEISEAPLEENDHACDAIRYMVQTIIYPRSM